MSNPYAAPDAALNGATSDGDETYEPQVFSVDGRIGRLRFLAYTNALAFAVGIIFGVLEVAFHEMSSIIKFLMYIPLLFISFVMAKRRLNDLNRGGGLSALLVIPLVNFIFWLYLAFAPGTPGPNEYGPKPAANSTLVVIGGLLLPFVFVLGILAAIALPAYQTYAMKAKAAAAHQAP